MEAEAIEVSNRSLTLTSDQAASRVDHHGPDRRRLSRRVPSLPRNTPGLLRAGVADQAEDRRLRSTHTSGHKIPPTDSKPPASDHTRHPTNTKSYVSENYMHPQNSEVFPPDRAPPATDMKHHPPDCKNPQANTLSQTADPSLRPSRSHMLESQEDAAEEMTPNPCNGVKRMKTNFAYIRRKNGYRSQEPAVDPRLDACNSSQDPHSTSQELSVDGCNYSQLPQIRSLQQSLVGYNPSQLPQNSSSEQSLVGFNTAQGPASKESVEDSNSSFNPQHHHDSLDETDSLLGQSFPLTGFGKLQPSSAVNTAPTHPHTGVLDILHPAQELTTDFEESNPHPKSPDNHLYVNASFGPESPPLPTTLNSQTTHGNPHQRTPNTPISSHVPNTSSLPSSTTPGPTSLVNYAFRGALSPLRGQVAVKRSLGPVDEVSFVIARPKPSAADKSKIYGNPGIAKCMLPHSGRHLSRPLSPSSDILPHSGRHLSRPLSPSSDILPQGTWSKPGSTRRVLSPPPRLGLIEASETRQPLQGGTCCERCKRCLVEFKQQTFRLLLSDTGSGIPSPKTLSIEQLRQRLILPESCQGWFSRGGSCGLCLTSLASLQQEAVNMAQSIQLAQVHSLPVRRTLDQALPQWNRCDPTPAQMLGWSPVSSVTGATTSADPSVPLAAQAQAYLEQNVRAYISPHTSSQAPLDRHWNTPDPVNQTLDSSPDPFNNTSSSNITQSGASRSGSLTPSSRQSPIHNQQHHLHLQHLHQQQHHLHQHQNHHRQQHAHASQRQQNWPGHAHPASPPPGYGTSAYVPSRSIHLGSPISCPLSPPGAHSAAVSFFARAAQKLGKKKKRLQSQDQEPSFSYATNFAEVVRLTPPPAPPCLLRTVGRLQNPGMGKVKVMIKICHPVAGHGELGASFLSTDPRKKQVTVFDPSASGYVTSANRRVGTMAPKMFAFDSVVTPDDSLTELCGSSLADIIQAVVAGADGCVFTYGYSKLGKSYTMIGSDQSSSTLGVIPCAIAWLFKLINEQKDKTGARFSVRVSAVQVVGKEELLRDLLLDIAQAGTEATGAGTAPSVYLRDDPICGTQLENQSELRAPTADKAAFYLDAALASRLMADEDEARSSHLLFTLNVYQYRIEKTTSKAGLPGVAGGRSRLHLIDLGTASRSKDSSNVSLSLSALGSVVMALLNGQRHVPHRDSKIGQLLRDSLGNLSCRTCMLAHVSSSVTHYNESLQVIQLAARIHRMKRRRTKFSSTSSEDSSTDGDAKFRRPYRGLRMGTLREDVLYSSSHSDPDYTSSSEQSCDTVIYIGANGQSLSDRELTDNEGPPRHVPRTNPRLPRRPSGSRSSGDDSDSGRSMHSVRSLDSRLPLKSLSNPQSQRESTGFSKADHVSSLPGSPNPGLVRMRHLVGLSGQPVAVSGEQVYDGSVGHKTSPLHSFSPHYKSAKVLQEKPLDAELWIDGPGVRVYPETKGDEMWVDGPQAFVVKESQPYLHPGESGSNARSSAVKKVGAEEQWIDGPKEMLAENSHSQPMHTCIKSEQASKHLVGGGSERFGMLHAVKHADVTRKCDITQVHQSSISSTYKSSEKAASSPSPSRTTKLECQKLAAPSRQQADAASSPLLSVKRQKLIETSKTPSSPLLSPKQSPSLGRKSIKVGSGHTVDPHRAELASSPADHGPTNRVAQWIKSVSASGQEVAGCDTQVAAKVEHCKLELTSQSDVRMTDAETNTEHDSDFERLVEEIDIKSDSREDLPEFSSRLETAPDSCANAGQEDPSRFSKLTAQGCWAVIGHKSESVYEMEVDRQLELMKTADGTRLAADVDNETFSSFSCSNKDAEEAERDQCYYELESPIIQQTKALTESHQNSQLFLHLSCRRLSGGTSPPSCACRDEVPRLLQPSLAHKLEGTSHPNLLKIVCENCSGDKNKHKLNRGLPDRTGTIVVSRNESSINFPTTSLKSSILDENDEDEDVQYSLCFESKTNTAEVKCQSEHSPLLHHKGLSKLGCSSQAPVNPGSLHCVAKQTHQAMEHPGSLQKGTSGRTTPDTTLSSPKACTKFAHSDKRSCSSSGISHSPYSSATSSPLVSTTSKSTSSSPVRKTSSKVHYGSSIKLPSFSSLKTMSPSNKDHSRSRKKIKECRPRSNSQSNLWTNLALRGSKGNDSDSGNDSGIVAHDKRLLSPYATITKPRTPSHSSSGHGSDNSTISTDVLPGHCRPCAVAEILQGGTSSGYESMLRDSEASSGQEDSEAETTGQTKKESKTKGASRSRSAPAHSSEIGQSGKSGNSSNRLWVDTRNLHKVKDEPLELKRYDSEEVDRLDRRRGEDEDKDMAGSRQKKSLTKLEEVSRGAVESKDRIVLEQSSWLFDCRLLMCFSCKSRRRGTDV